MTRHTEDNFRHKITRILNALETGFLVLLVALLLLSGLAQFFLRNFFHTGLLWLEPLSRYLVLWITFLGALKAAGEERHIRIDLVPRLLKGRARTLFDIMASLSAATVCLFLARWALDFLRMEREFGGMAFLAVPTWIALAAIPVGFLCLGLRMGGRAIQELLGFTQE